MNKRIYSEIKRRIVFLDYRPGQILYTKQLMEEFGVSLTPIREVLICLEAEELVYMVPNRGAYVREVSFKELKDIFEVRLFLIGQSGRLAAQRINDEELKEIKKLLKKIKQAKERKLLIQLDSEFHNLVNEASKNKALAKTLERLRNQVARLWFFATEENDTYAMQIPEDFEKLVRALEQRDQAKSEQILRDHAIRFIEQIKMSLYEGTILQPAQR